MWQKQVFWDWEDWFPLQFLHVSHQRCFFFFVIFFSIWDIFYWIFSILCRGSKFINNWIYVRNSKKIWDIACNKWDWKGQTSAFQAAKLVFNHMIKYLSIPEHIVCGSIWGALPSILAYVFTITNTWEYIKRVIIFKNKITNQIK